MGKVVVIGSGFGGLSAAMYAGKAGHEVLVLEKNEQLGGRASVFESDGFRWDMGPSWYLMPDLFEKFFNEFDENVHDWIELTQLNPSYKVFFPESDRAIDVYDTIEKNMLTFEEIEPGSTEQLRKYLKKAEYQYEVAMREFVPKNYDSIWDFFTLRMAIEGSKMNVFTKMSKYVKKYFKTSEMQKIMQYPLVFLGTAPNDAPAMYNIMSRVDFGMGVFYPQGGIYAIIEALVKMSKKYRVTYQTDSEVTSINVSNGVASGVTLQDGTVIDADIVISNADMRRTETHLLERQRQTYTESYWESRTLAPSGFIVYLGIKGKVKNIQHHTLIFSEDRDKNFNQIFHDKIAPTDPSFYICCPSKTDPSVAPEGDENMFILVPFPPGLHFTAEEKEGYKKKIYKLIEEQIGDTFQDRIVYERLFGVEEFQSRYNAYQGTALGIAHTMKQTAIFRPNNISKKVNNLFYTGGYTNPGIGMPMCLISGKLAYKRIEKRFDT